MAIKKSGLGKGLDSLIPKQTAQIEKRTTGETVQRPADTKRITGEEPQKPADIKQTTGGTAQKPVDTKQTADGTVVTLRLTEIEPNRDQPRKKFDEDPLIELADSIRQFGVLQPLIVQKKGDYYEIIAGERRWRAARIAGLKEVPAIIRSFTGQQAVEISLIENIQREDLNPIEEANAYKRLLTEFHLKQDEVAEKVSRSRTAVTNSMRLLKLDERVQQMVVDEMISTGHARTLLALEDKEAQYRLATKIFDEKLTVRDTENLVKKFSQKPKEKTDDKESSGNNVIYEDLENKIKTLLGTKVVINHKKNNKGKIVIDYYSEEDLERLMILFQSIPQNGA